MAITICKSSFGNTLQLAVEIAWGADPRGNAGSYTWTDVTADVMTVNPIEIVRGRSDESSTCQPASCTFHLKNTTGAYIQGASGPNYPNVRRNTPIRIRLILSGISYTRFWGYATTWKPSWNLAGRFPAVEVVANGALQRLTQGAPVLQSALRRGFSKLTTNAPVGYWPLEDGAGAKFFSPGMVGEAPLIYHSTVSTGNREGVPQFSAWDKFPASKGIAWSNGAAYEGKVNNYTKLSPNKVMVQFLFVRGTNDINDNTTLVDIYTDSATPNYTIVYYNNGGVGFKIWDWQNTTYSTSLVRQFNIGNGPTIVRLHWTQNGTSVDFTISAYDCLRGTYQLDTSSTANVSIGKVLGVRCFDGNNGELAIGHLTIQNNTDTINTLAGLYKGWAGELTTARFTRLGAEEKEPVSVVGTSSLTMGIQSQGTFVELLQTCADTEMGLLADGNTQGPCFYTRESTDSIPATLTLDMNQRQIKLFDPVDDDLLNLNQISAKSPVGSEIDDEDSSGQFGYNKVGGYSSSLTFNTYNDLELPHYAGWALRKGTVFGPSDASNYRYPNVPIDLHRNVSMASTVLANMDLLKRIDMVNVNDKLTQQQDIIISNQVQGYKETISSTAWRVDYNCTPYDVARVGVFAATTGDTGEFVGQFDTDGSTLATAAAQGTTSLTVQTDAGLPWTTASDDFPLTINCGDIPITVTGISNSVIDSFTRTVSSQWGTATTGQTWSTVGGSASDFSTNGSQGKIAASTVNVERYSILNFTSSSFEIQCNFSSSALATGGSQVVGLVARYADAGNRYHAYAQLNTNQTITIGIDKKVLGTTTTLGTLNTGLTHSAGTFYTLLFSGQGSALKVRLWATSASRLISWDCIGNDTSFTSGKLGVRTILSSGNTNTLPVNFLFDNFWVNNPQTFVTSSATVTKAIPSGSKVKLWNAPAMEL